MPEICVATTSDVASFPYIERSAGKLFRSVNELAWIADDEVAPVDFYFPLLAQGCVWIARDEGNATVGFLASEPLDGDLHVWQVAVSQSYQRLGYGRRLFEAALKYCFTNGLKGLTLTTFRNVPWNGPYYRRVGFIELQGAGIPRRLDGLLCKEQSRGLPRDLRCAMRLALEATSLDPPESAENRKA